MMKTKIIVFAASILALSLLAIIYQSQDVQKTSSVVSKALVQSKNDQMNDVSIQSTNEQANVPKDEIDTYEAAPSEKAKAIAEYKEFTSTIDFTGDHLGKLSVDSTVFAEMDLNDKFSIKTNIGDFNGIVVDKYLDSNGYYVSDILSDDGSDSFAIYHPQTKTTFLSIKNQILGFEVDIGKEESIPVYNINGIDSGLHGDEVVY